MEFRTKVEIGRADFTIPPCEEMLFVGSCFADRMGSKFQEDKFHAIVNPYGVMYNPASILHTIEKCGQAPHVAVLTLGTNHVYLLKSSNEIVDNCQKRPQHLFWERELSIEDCFSYLAQAVEILTRRYAHVKVIITVSPIRYAKYGFHESQLSKATLLLATNQLVERYPQVFYFPAYEIMNDELRDYRFYQEDMLHPSDQAVEYIWECFSKMYFGDDTLAFLKEWKPIKEALGHRPFHPESEEYKQFMNKTMLKVSALSEKYPNFAL